MLIVACVENKICKFITEKSHIKAVVHKHVWIMHTELLKN